MLSKSGPGALDERPEDDFMDVVEDDLPPEEDDIVSGAQSSEREWRVLVVDDDVEVHSTTTFALAGVDILGRRLTLEHAHSGVEALELLRMRGPDFAVILLDVVMETDDAGLRTAQAIREELGLSAVRIILRTGQPGYAPELTVIRDYDINDYRTKSELTRTRLLSSLFSALRAYGHIQNLEISRRGLEKIITASADLFRRRSLAEFSEGILIQISGLLGMETNGIVLVRQLGGADGRSKSEPVILAAAGPFSHLAGAPLASIPEQGVRSVLVAALEQRKSYFGTEMTVLYITGPSGDDVAVFLSTSQELEPLDRKLLEVFSSNVALGFDNLGLIDNVRMLAFFDPLTKLPNRTQLQIEIETRLATMKAAAIDAKLAVMLVDLDHFQMLNDGLGHAAGDDLLRLVAGELSQVFDEPGAVSRLSGDLFGILARVRGQEDEATLVDLVGLCFSRTFPIGDNELTVTISGGYTVVKSGEVDVPEAIRCAGMALKRAKRAGRGQIVRYGATMAEELKSRLTLVNQLAEAKTGNQMSLYYQPQLRLSDRAVIGAEALMRWRRPDGAFIRPDMFIPAAEDSGHIVPLGEWVLRQACLKQVSWRQSGLGRLRVAVNVSVRQLRERGFSRMVERTLVACNADPADIELEITESTAMESDRILGAVRELRDIGFRIAIDDFGTGHSSLARLSQLPVAMLKIDRAFVDGIDTRSNSRAIASMIVKMGHELGFSVLAEGVETETQERILRELGCDYVQGYLYAKPLPPDELAAWLGGRTLAMD